MPHLLVLCHKYLISSNLYLISSLSFVIFQGPIPDILQEVEAPLLPQEECREWHIENGYPEIAPPDSEICSGYFETGPGACRVRVFCWCLE